MPKKHGKELRNLWRLKLLSAFIRGIQTNQDLTIKPRETSALRGSWCHGTFAWV
jgi:hypothetical protein